MIEKYFMEGVRFKWGGVPSIIAAQDGTIVPSVQQPTPMEYIGLSDKVAPNLMFTHVSTYGLTMRMQIPYGWCDYAQGRTATVPLAGTDILTGFMSGCPIVRFQSAGQWYVGHIGTVQSDAVNRLVKTTFRNAMANYQNVSGFFPAAAWAAEQVALAQKHQKNPKVMALVTSTGAFYSILMLQDMHQLQEWVCGGCKRVVPMNPMMVSQALA